MFKKFRVITWLTLWAVLLSAAPMLAAPSVSLDGRPLTFDVPPRAENGRILVPIRAIGEAMGANVTWDQTNNTVIAVRDNTTVIIPLGSTTPTLNGTTINIDAAAQAVDGRILVPLRFVVEAFGGTVLWNQSMEAISIYSTALQLPAGVEAGNFVPLGNSYLTAEGFEIRVDSLLQDSSAWSIIAANNPLLASPSADRKYVIVTCTVRNVSTLDDPETISDIDFELIGSSNQIFHTYDKIVALPNEGPLRELRKVLRHGEEATGSYAFYVPHDENDLFLIWHPYFSNRAYFELR